MEKIRKIYNWMEKVLVFFGFFKFLGMEKFHLWLIISGLIKSNIRFNRPPLMIRHMVVVMDLEKYWFPHLTKVKNEYPPSMQEQWIKTFENILSIYKNHQFYYLEEVESVDYLYQQIDYLNEFKIYLENKNSIEAQSRFERFKGLFQHDRLKADTIDDHIDGHNYVSIAKVLDGGYEDSISVNLNVNSLGFRLVILPTGEFTSIINQKKSSELAEFLQVFSANPMNAGPKRISFALEFDNSLDLSHYKYKSIGSKNNFPCFIDALKNRGFFYDGIELDTNLLLLCAREFGLWTESQDKKNGNQKSDDVKLKGSAFKRSRYMELIPEWRPRLNAHIKSIGL